MRQKTADSQIFLVFDVWAPWLAGLEGLLVRTCRALHFEPLKSFGLSHAQLRFSLLGSSVYSLLQ